MPLHRGVGMRPGVSTDAEASSPMSKGNRTRGMAREFLVRNGSSDDV